MNEWEEIVGTLSEEINSSGKTLAQISAESGVSMYAVSRIWYRSYLSSPRASTLMIMLRYFGYTFHYRKTSNSGLQVIKRVS